ncbi:MAG: hypothetical protein II306_05935 [Clostridia bacterium]|nr:hypothetical protein [Clostridia bacterium]
MTFKGARKFLNGELMAVTIAHSVSSAAQKKRLESKFAKFAALNLAIVAIDKQIPKKPLSGIDFMGNEFRICCDCSAIVRDGEWRANYCPDCGQALDWSDNDD